MLGDIILAYETCAAEAEEKQISVADHATHLVIHGMLHLLGHDHVDDDEAEADPGAVNGRGTTDGSGGTYRGDDFPSFGAANNATKN
jgi:hypothetical protein